MEVVLVVIAVLVIFSVLGNHRAGSVSGKSTPRETPSPAPARGIPAFDKEDQLREAAMESSADDLDDRPSPRPLYEDRGDDYYYDDDGNAHPEQEYVDDDGMECDEDGNPL